MILVIGLGNPGKQYTHTRHNIGFIAVDYLINRYNFLPETKKKFNSVIAIGNILSNVKLLLAKPQTFMNLSGEAAKSIVSYYKIPTNNIIVIHDDADLPLGKIKFKLGGGNAGHNGLRSIDQHLGFDYYRIRIGIGKHPHMNLADYVLSEFTKDEIFTLNKSIETIADSINLLYQGDIDLFQKYISS